MTSWKMRLNATTSESTLKRYGRGSRLNHYPKVIGLVFVSAAAFAGCGGTQSAVEVAAVSTPANFHYAPGAFNQALEDGIPVASNIPSDVVEAPSTAATLPADSLFETGSYQLLPGAAASLEKVAKNIQSLDPSAGIEFVGHADSRGDAAANQLLSQQRAQTVLQWFQKHGFSSNKMNASGVGATEPLVPDTDASGNFISAAGTQNRRVDIILHT